MDLEIIILSEVRQRQIPNAINSVWNLKYNTNELIYETETDSQNRLVIAKGGKWGRDEVGVRDYQILLRARVDK